MATTTSPLVWSFYREVSGADDVAGVAHYYDEQSQSLYLVDGGISTQTAEIEDGHWKTATPGSEVDITTDTFDVLRLDHPSNGTLYAAATDGSSLTFLRYVYMMDLSPIIDSWSWSSQNDNAISEFSGSVQNVGSDIFTDEVSLFQPGARIALSIKMGDSQAYPIGVAWLDECDYDISAETVELSGRNTVGYFLKDQTFDDQCTYTGISSDIVTQIFTYAGVTKYLIETGNGTLPFTFKPSDTLLDGIQEMLSAYTDTVNEWKLIELPDGTVCVGYESWFNDKMPNGYYSFNEGSDVFKRKTTKLSDSSYTSIRVTGKDANDADLTPVTVAVTNFQYWALGAHRTMHLTAPDGLTQVGMQEWAEAQAAKYQYIGIGEDFTGPFKPNLLVGDVAQVVEGDIGTSLGIITEVRQRFSRSEGYVTEFSVDSGGVVTDGESYNIYSRASKVNGFNRRQRVIDLMRIVAGK